MVSGREQAARQYVHDLRAFAIHRAFFAAGMTLIFLVNLATNLAAGLTGQWSAWWSMWALLGWGAGITVHGLVLRLSRPMFAEQSWEQSKIDKVLAG